MKISTKTLIGTISAVLLAVVFLTVGAALLNIRQIQVDNKKRLEIAVDEVRQLFLKPMADVEAKHNQFVETSPKMIPFYPKILLQDSLIEVKIEIELSTLFTQQMVLYGKTNDNQFGFFSHLGTSSKTPQLKFQYINELGGLVVENYLITPNKYGINTKNLDAPIPFPQFIDFEGISSIQLIDEMLYLAWKLPLIFQGEEAQGNIKPGDPLGHFLILNQIDIDFERKNRNLGTQINIYNSQGELIFGNKEFGNINTEDIELTQEVFDLETESEELFDALLAPLYYKGTITGYLSVAISQKSTQEKTLQLIYLQLAITSVIVILVGIFTFIFVNRLLKPLSKVTLLLKDIAAGEGDLTQRLKFSGKDEIGQLSQWFNMFVEKLQILIGQVQQDTHSMVFAFEELSRNATEIKSSSSNITDSIASESAAIVESSSTITHMVKSLQNMFDGIKEIQTKANKSEETATYGAEVIRDLDEKISMIEKSSKKIESVVDVISSISSQTDLLSLNAAIEAAKAGEHGKGFAVVADEIRVLSTKSHSSTKQIAELIGASSGSVQEGLKVIVQTKELLDRITKQVREISGRMNNLGDEMNAQENRIKEISAAIDEISNLSEDNASSIQQLSHSIDESDITTSSLSTLSESLINKVNRFKIK